MTNLTHRLALVTGSAHGIGLACAKALAAAGATVISTDIDDAAGLASLPSIGRRAQFHHLDVREETDWQQAIDHVLAAHGRLDVLVNNAGTTGFDLNLGPQDPEHASLDAWRAVHATNLDGVFLGCKYGITAMRSRGTGSIINMSSRSGLVGIPAAAAYASSKAAIRNHTKTVALYCAEQGLAIRCNSLHPAAILTRMWEPMLGNGPDREARIAALVADTPLRRFGTVEEVAAAVLYLAADDSAYMTGSELNLDGGILAGSVARISADAAN
jgi:NAD(P)-dependent dehydrogenase (short-subunit alcohol dehydrogenase family)